MMRFLKAIFGVDAPAPPDPNNPSSWHPTAAQMAAFYARHPMFSHKPLPPPSSTYHASVPSGSGPMAPAVATSPSGMANAAATAGQLASLATQVPSMASAAASDVSAASSALSSIASSFNGDTVTKKAPDGTTMLKEQPTAEMGDEMDCDWVDEMFDECHGSPYTHFKVEYAPVDSIDPFGLAQFGDEMGYIPPPAPPGMPGYRRGPLPPSHPAWQHPGWPNRQHWGGGGGILGNRGIMPGQPMPMAPGRPMPPGGGMNTWARWQQVHPGTPYSDYQNWYQQYGASGASINGEEFGFEDEFMSADQEMPALLFGFDESYPGFVPSVSAGYPEGDFDPTNDKIAGEYTTKG